MHEVFAPIYLAVPEQINQSTRRGSVVGCSAAAALASSSWIRWSTRSLRARRRSSYASTSALPIVASSSWLLLRAPIRCAALWPAPELAPVSPVHGESLTSTLVLLALACSPWHFPETCPSPPPTAAMPSARLRCRRISIKVFVLRRVPKMVVFRERDSTWYDDGTSVGRVLSFIYALLSRRSAEPSRIKGKLIWIVTCA